MADPMLDVCVVIPAFRESTRLPRFLDDLVGRLRQQRYRSAVIVVDDGSGLEERAALERVVGAHASSGVDVRGVYLPRNMGKGYAVRTGWDAASGARWLAFADADGATAADEVVRVVTHAVGAGDERRCYFGSRVRMLGRSVGRRWPRHVVGRVYATLVALLIREGVYDSQCGLKVVPAAAYARVRPCLRENRFAFDCELIVALSEAGCELIEVPINWHDVPGSRVSLLRDPLRMLASVVRLRTRLRQGEFRALRAGRAHPEAAADQAAR